MTNNITPNTLTPNDSENITNNSAKSYLGVKCLGVRKKTA